MRACATAMPVFDASNLNASAVYVCSQCCISNDLLAVEATCRRLEGEVIDGHPNIQHSDGECWGFLQCYSSGY